MTFFRALTGIGAVLQLMTATAVLAQNTEDQNVFDFSLPGARSRAIGGAFVAIADDATSAYSNPAGLTLLFRPEVSIEGRYWGLTSSTPSRGHAFGPATQIGTDTIDGLVYDRFHKGTSGVSFASFVYPGDGWAVGVFRHQLAHHRMERQIVGPYFQCSGGYRNRPPVVPPFCEPFAIPDGVDREFPKRQSFALDIAGTGAAFAFNLPPRVAVGVGVEYFDFEILSVNKVFMARGANKYASPNYTDPDNLELIGTQQGEDHAWAMNAGVLWNVSPRVVVGASFRQGPKFEFSTSTVTGPSRGSREFNAQSDNPFHVPDTYSLGFLYRLTNFWRLSLEYDRVNFHQLIDDFRNTAFSDNNPEERDAVLAGVRMNNANQVRLGGERLALLSGGRVLALRGGVWYDPNHQTYFDADEATGLPAPRWAILLPKQDGNLHVSGGIGFTTRRHFQVDVAADFSDLVDTFSVSSVWRF